MPDVSNTESDDSFNDCLSGSKSFLWSSFGSLEQTPDVFAATTLTGLNLYDFFDDYDIYLSTEDTCPAIKYLCKIMCSWIDEQPLSVQAMILNANIYTSGFVLEKFSSCICDTLVDNYLLTNGVKDDKNNDEGFTDRIDNGEFYYTPNIHTDSTGLIQIYDEKEIILPANIASSIIQNPRLYNFLLNFKSRLKRTFELEVAFESMHDEYLKILYEKRLQDLPMNSLIDNLSFKTYNKKQKKTKKVIKKGIKKFSNLFENKNISSFISGDGFVVAGTNFNWCFKPLYKGSILTLTQSPLLGHIPYKLSIQTKDNLVLCDCCVYVAENTPVIDQIITIMLYIKHDEDELLNNINIFNKRPDYENNQHLFPKHFHTAEQDHSLTEVTIDDGQSVAISSYSEEKTRLNDLYKDRIIEMIPSIIGIDKDFFNFMLNCNENPIITGNKDATFKSNLSRKELLLS